MGKTLTGLVLSALLGCGGPELPRRVTVEMGPSQECGLLPATLRSEVPSTLDHGSWRMDVWWAGETLEVDDADSEGRGRLDCSVPLGGSGECTMVLLIGGEWRECRFPAAVRP